MTNETTQLTDETATKVPCPACDGAGRTVHRIPGVPPGVCVRSSPCDACWPRDDNGDKVLWNDGTAGWVTEAGAARIREGGPEGTVQVTLTHDEWVLTLNALHVYAREEEMAADAWPEASRRWAQHQETARQANMLHSKLAMAYGTVRR